MKKILIVDDEPRITEAFEQAFRSDYEVFSAHDGREAIRLIQEITPALIVLDWRLKGEVEGRDVLAFSKREYPKTSVYVVTASFHFTQEINSSGADACFLKPCGDLKDKIEQVFSKAEQSDASR